MIDEIFAKVADYHMDHRGHIGLAAGMAAGFLFARSGAEASFVGLFFEMLFGNDNPAVEQLGLVTQFTGIPSIMLAAAGVLTDAAIHKGRVADKERKRNEEQVSRDVNGPQPPAP